MGWYDVAQVCMNGHVVNDTAQRNPEFNKQYCDRCGEKTITACLNCNTAVQGDYHCEGVTVIGTCPTPAPAFCHNCGNPFPWTTAKQLAAIELFLEEDQSKEDQDVFRQSVEQIAKDTPQAQVASKRIGKLLGKISKETASAIRDILVDVASETAKKLLFPGT